LGGRYEHLFTHFGGYGRFGRAEQAVDFAAKLANEHGSELIVSHFVNWVPVVTEAAASGAITDPGIIDELRAAGDQFIERAKSGRRPRA